MYLMSKQEFSVPEIARSYHEAIGKSPTQKHIEDFIHGKITQSEYGKIVRQETREAIENLSKKPEDQTKLS